jgi:ABC-type multidrug transport system permease subunit
MKPAIILSIVAILVSFVALVLVARSQVRGRKASMFLLVATMQLGFSIIAGELIPAGVIANLTQSLFIVPAFIMLGLFIREQILARRASAKTR